MHRPPSGPWLKITGPTSPQSLAQPARAEQVWIPTCIKHYKSTAPVDMKKHKLEKAQRRRQTKISRKRWNLHGSEPTPLEQPGQSSWAILCPPTRGGWPHSCVGAWAACTKSDETASAWFFRVLYLCTTPSHTSFCIITLTIYVYNVKQDFEGLRYHLYSRQIWSRCRSKSIKDDL